MFKMTRSHNDFLIQFTLFSMGLPRCDFLREVSAVAIGWVYGRDDLLEQVPKLGALVPSRSSA
jgi:hypothetical protein